VDKAAVSQLIELGFDKNLAAVALEEAGNDLVKAVDLLTR
jgi:NACalpha-BTF3-like transcription factor